jgi:hypothetical protein
MCRHLHLHHPSGRDGVNAEIPLIYHHKPDARDRASRALAGRHRKQRIKYRVAFLVAPNDHIGSKSLSMAIRLYRIHGRSRPTWRRPILITRRCSAGRQARHWLVLQPSSL